MTGISLDITDAFSGINASGTTAPRTNRNIPSTASGDSFFGNLIEFSGQIDSTGQVTFSNLDTSATYQIELFASRISNDRRSTLYTVAGKSEASQVLNVSNNDSIMVILKDVSPNAQGQIDIQVTAAADNSNAFKFFYLGAIILSYEGYSAPKKPSTVLTYPNGGEYWQSGKQPRRFDQERVDLQLEMRDSTFSIYGDRTIDFWTGFHDMNDLPLSQYDSGDGVHLNNAGHRLLLEKVLEKNIPQRLLSNKGTTYTRGEYQALNIFPNPTQQWLKLDLNHVPSGMKYQLNTTSGRVIEQGYLNSKLLAVSGLTLGTYFLVLTLKNGQELWTTTFIKSNE